MEVEKENKTPEEGKLSLKEQLGASEVGQLLFADEKIIPRDDEEEDHGDIEEQKESPEDVPVLTGEEEELKRKTAEKKAEDEAALQELRKHQTAGVSDITYVRPPTKYPPPTDCVDSFLRFLGIRKPEPERTPVLTTANDVANCREAMERVKYALNYNAPGTVLRWDKLLTVCNRTIEPTEVEPDPLRINLEMEEFKLVLRTLYQRAKTSENDGVSLMREYLPKMYDKHSFDRGKRVSQRERDKKGLTDECFAYGELEPESFLNIYCKVSEAYGKWDKSKKPVFFDLGCGVGNLVYTAAFVGPFFMCGGIENIEQLLDRGEKRMVRWDRLVEKLPKAIKNTKFLWEQDNFLQNQDLWSDATFVLLHWTAFNREQLELAGDLFGQLREGTLVISFTNPIPNPDYEILVKDAVEVSWGQAVFYVQEKLTPRRSVRGQPVKIDLDGEDDEDGADGENEEVDESAWG